MIIQCPNTYIPVPGDCSVFMAGGITGCPDWQATFKTFLLPPEQEDHVVWLNPRRDNFDVTDPSMSEAQIEWEYEYLNSAETVLFWFPKETLCPITLFELGYQLGKGNTVFVGTDPEYKRRFDVVKQCSLAVPSIEVADNLDDLVGQVLEWDLEFRTGKSRF